MRKNLKASHYCLLFTLISTIILYSLFGLSIVTVAGFFSGMILSIINLIEDEMKQYERDGNG